MDATDSASSPPRLVGNYEIKLSTYRRPGEPENYRLSSTLPKVPKPPPQTKPIHFWFKTRYISGLASHLSPRHPHLLHVHLEKSTAAWLVRQSVKLLPGFARPWAERIFPEWFLPDHVVLKMEKLGEEKAAMEELFDTEVKVYERLEPLQGVVVPRCYGRIRYNGSRALILERLGGVSLASPEAATLRLDELADLLLPCYQALHAFGVHYDDPQLANFQLVDAKVMVLDFEQVMLDRSADDNAFFTMTGIRHLAQLYREMQVWYRHEGLLEAA